MLIGYKNGVTVLFNTKRQTIEAYRYNEGRKICCVLVSFGNQIFESQNNLDLRFSHNKEYNGRVRCNGS